MAQGIAGLPLFSGMWLRIAAFVAFLSVSIVYVTMHAIKVRKNPESSPVYEEDKTHVVNIDVYNVPKLTIRHKLVLALILVEARSGSYSRSYSVWHFISTSFPLSF